MVRVRYETDPTIPPPRPVTATFTFDEDELPTRTVVIELDGGDISTVTLRKRPPWLSQDLRLPWSLIMGALREMAPGYHPGGRQEHRKLTDEFLTAVADAYRSTGGIAGITPEIDERFAASDAAKYRWVKAARDRGLLEARED